MKALEIQKEMNNAYANRSYKKAYALFLKMNIQREIEGMAKLTLPNLQSRFE